MSWARHVAGMVEKGNEYMILVELLGSIQWWETTERLHNWWPLEWCSAPQSQLLLCKKTPSKSYSNEQYKNKQNSWSLVRKQTILTERPRMVGEVNVKFSW
jgi:hypothetical protein